MSALLLYIKRIIVKFKPDKVVFLGDLFHFHNTLSSRVMNLWLGAIKELRNFLSWDDLIILKGNHDLSDPHDDNSPNSVAVFASFANVVTDYYKDNHDFLYLPYYASKEKFLKLCNNHKTKFLVCHQSFDGSQYENGFYAKDGVEPSLIPQEYVITGHIHLHQRVNKVFYTGSPRWRTISDANEKKYIWLSTFLDNKIQHRGFSTSSVCRPIKSINIDNLNIENFLNTPYLLDNSLLYINLYGEKDFLIKYKSVVLAKVPQARIRIFEKQNNNIQVKESDGLGNALLNYINNSKTEYNTDKKILIKLAKERISWL